MNNKLAQSQETKPATNNVSYAMLVSDGFLGLVSAGKVCHAG
jgi:hypothetical protein